MLVFVVAYPHVTNAEQSLKNNTNYFIPRMYKLFSEWYLNSNWERCYVVNLSVGLYQLAIGL